MNMHGVTTVKTSGSVIRDAAACPTPTYGDALVFEGGKVIQLCHQKSPRPNTLHFREHSLLFLEEGEFRVASPEITIWKGEAVFIRKATHVDYRKFPSPDGAHCTGILFSFSDAILKDFLKRRTVPNRLPTDPPRILRLETEVELAPFMALVKSYLESPVVRDEPELIRLKVLEILHLMVRSNPEIAASLFGFLAPPPTDIVAVMEENFLKPLSIQEFAYLSGRSLSKFKRDFAAVFQTPPAEWLRVKRLDYAHRLLTATNLTITEVCYEAGFEDVAHFSRTFKRRFGCPPSALKKEPHRQPR